MPAQGQGGRGPGGGSPQRGGGVPGRRGPPGRGRRGGGSGNRRQSAVPRRRRTEDVPQAVWEPKTQLGKLVRDGTITTMSDALQSGLALREPEITDILLPDMKDEVLDRAMVQRMTDSGRRVRFRVTVGVGNEDGFVGIGQASGKEMGPTIKRAINNAKINLIEVRRGCGSWECGCQTPHSLPFEVTGECGSVRVTLKPGPRGLTLAAGDVAKSVLRLAGVKDVWTFTKGHTKSTINYAYATFDALGQTAGHKVMKEQAQRLKIVTGGIMTSKTDGGEAAVAQKAAPADVKGDASAAPAEAPAHEAKEA